MADGIVATPTDVFICDISFGVRPPGLRRKRCVPVYKPEHRTQSLSLRAHECLWTWPAGTSLAFIPVGMQLHGAFRSRVRRTGPQAKGGVSR